MDSEEDEEVSYAQVAKAVSINARFVHIPLIGSEQQCSQHSHMPVSQVRPEVQAAVQASAQVEQEETPEVAATDNDATSNEAAPKPAESKVWLDTLCPPPVVGSHARISHSIAGGLRTVPGIQDVPQPWGH